MGGYSEWVRAGEIHPLGKCPVGRSFRVGVAANHTPDRIDRALSPHEGSRQFSQGRRDIAETLIRRPLPAGRHGRRQFQCRSARAVRQFGTDGLHTPARRKERHVAPHGCSRYCQFVVVFGSVSQRDRGGHVLRRPLCGNRRRGIGLAGGRHGFGRTGSRFRSSRQGLDGTMLRRRLPPPRFGRVRARQDRGAFFNGLGGGAVRANVCGDTRNRDGTERISSMCGIAGFWDWSGSPNRDEMRRRVERMTGSLAHRGPDAAGVWLDAGAGIALGHRRLSILDLSADGSQPMRSRCGHYVISFNGEVYNYRALREELAATGHTFRGTSDTEVMLAAIAEWGLDRALEKFNGMFAFALWDAQNRQLHLARDRAGEKPLYYGLLKGALVFGSEVKALRAHPDFDAEIDRNALALYLRHSYIPASHTIYEGIYKLPAAAILTIPPTGWRALPEPRPYWRLRDAAEGGIANPFTGSPEEAVSQLEL